MMTGLTLKCPIRGILKVSSRTKDGLKPSEEYRRVEAIRYLLKQGYPKDNFVIEPILKKFGNSGRNSFRSDFAVLDVPVNTLGAYTIDDLLQHALVICEVKRENKDYDSVKSTQVKPMLDFAKNTECFGLYWDDILQRIFWQEMDGTIRMVREGPISMIPGFGEKVTASPIKFDDTQPPESLIAMFSEIEDNLHKSSIDPERRYEAILQILLAKIFDEHSGKANPTAALNFQDFDAIGVSEKEAVKRLNTVLAASVSYYERHLPKKLAKTFYINDAALIEASKILSPIRITASARDVIQTFYMKFAKDLYRWDLAQFFTPPPVIDFIIDVLNPTPFEHIKDPACGSADFLISAFHKNRHKNANYADCIWGSDNSENAVQVSILNMLLNGDGKTNIKREDSLETLENYKESYDILVCNPPFGTKILEKRPDVLAKFTLGNKGKAHTDVVIDAQETGLLFVELCISQAKPGKRIGLILPNGYLGNKSGKYLQFRSWLLRNCKIAAICGFPRFTFKSSGADVSTTVIFLEKYENPLDSLERIEDYPVSIEMIEKLGWDMENKRSAPIYRRSQDDGSVIITEEGMPILDADFENVLNRIRRSPAADEFSWLVQDTDLEQAERDGWAVSIKSITSDSMLTLDPKRHSRKFFELVESIKSAQHVTLRDIADIVPERRGATGETFKISKTSTYDYVEISNIGQGGFRSEQIKGWQMPDRGKHVAVGGDIFMGGIWSSVSKWFLAPNNQSKLIVTNGCHHIRIKEGKEEYLPDLCAFLCSEAYHVQARSMARGSDGLAEISGDDLLNIVIPIISDADIREEMKVYVERLLKGEVDLRSRIEHLIDAGGIDIPKIGRRPNHSTLV